MFSNPNNAILVEPESYVSTIVLTSVGEPPVGKVNEPLSNQTTRLNSPQKDPERATMFVLLEESVCTREFVPQSPLVVSNVKVVSCECVYANPLGIAV